MQRFRSAQTLEAALFEHAEQLGLHAGGKRGDFVEDDRSGLRHFQAAGFARNGAGECAALVSEQFGFDELGRQAGAINFQERCIVARAALVDPARELVFARAALAGNQDSGGSAGYFFRKFQHALGSGVCRNPGNLSGRAHGFLLAPNGSLHKNHGRGFATALCQEKSEEHSQERLCQEGTEALIAAWRCLRIRCGAHRGIWRALPRVPRQSRETRCAQHCATGVRGRNTAARVR